MPDQQPPPNFGAKLRNLFVPAERVLLAGAMIGIIMKRFGLDGNLILMVSLASLAGVYFLSAYLPPANPSTASDQPKSTKDLIYLTILPKITGISLAVAIVGILFALMHMPGAAQMLLIGSIAMGLVLVILGSGVAAGNEHARAMTPMLYRVIPILAISLYYFIRITPSLNS